MTRPLRARDRRGAAAVEFALCLIFVLMPLLGAVLEWGWYFYREITVMNIVRDGTRLAVSDNLSSSRSATASNWIGLRLTEVNLPNGLDTVAVDCPTATVVISGDTFDLMKVTATVPFDGPTNMLPTGANPPANLVVNYTVRTPDCT